MCVRIISQQETDRTSRPYIIYYHYNTYIIIFYMTSNIVRNQRLKKVSKERLTTLTKYRYNNIIYTHAAQTQMRCPALKSLTATQRCTKRNLQKVFFIVSFFFYYY